MARGARTRRVLFLVRGRSVIVVHGAQPTEHCGQILSAMRANISRVTRPRPRPELIGWHDADPTERALLLLSLLQTHRFWSGEELTARLGVSARTLRRDVDRLRSLGYPVDATPGAGGGYRLATGAHLPPLLLDDDEAVAIAVGLRTAAGASIDGMDDTALRAAGQARAGPARPPAPARAGGARQRRRRCSGAGDRPSTPTRSQCSRSRARDLRAGALRLPASRRRRLEPVRGAAPARVGRAAVVPGRVGRSARRLAHLPPRPARARAPRRRAVRAAPASRWRRRRVRRRVDPRDAPAARPRCSRSAARPTRLRRAVALGRRRVEAARRESSRVQRRAAGATTSSCASSPGWPARSPRRRARASTTSRRACRRARSASWRLYDPVTRSSGAERWGGSVGEDAAVGEDGVRAGTARRTRR